MNIQQLLNFFYLINSVNLFKKLNLSSFLDNININEEQDKTVINIASNKPIEIKIENNIGIYSNRNLALYGKKSIHLNPLDSNKEFIELAKLDELTDLFNKPKIKPHISIRKKIKYKLHKNNCKCGCQ